LDFLASWYCKILQSHPSHPPPGLEAAISPRLDAKHHKFILMSPILIQHHTERFSLTCNLSLQQSETWLPTYTTHFKTGTHTDNSNKNNNNKKKLNLLG
jgi:hypothetical protein